VLNESFVPVYYWINATFFDRSGQVIYEIGRYGQLTDSIFGKTVQVPTLLDSNVLRRTLLAKTPFLTLKLAAEGEIPLLMSGFSPSILVMIVGDIVY